MVRWGIAVAGDKDLFRDSIVQESPDSGHSRFKVFMDMAVGIPEEFDVWRFDSQDLGGGDRLTFAQGSHFLGRHQFFM